MEDVPLNRNSEENVHKSTSQRPNQVLRNSSKITQLQYSNFKRNYIVEKDGDSKNKIMTETGTKNSANGRKAERNHQTNEIFSQNGEKRLAEDELQEVTCHLPILKQIQLKEVLLQYINIFAKDTSQPGTTNVIKHEINTGKSQVDALSPSWAKISTIRQLLHFSDQVSVGSYSCILVITMPSVQSFRKGLLLLVDGKGVDGQ